MNRIERANAVRARARALRAEGRTWEQVGQVLGLSREQARQRGTEADQTLSPLVAAPAQPAEPVAGLELSIRVLRALVQAGFVDVAQLRAASDAELLEIPGLGPRGLAEIRAAVAR